jgi:hypothetical protein
MAARYVELYEEVAAAEPHAERAASS